MHLSNSPNSHDPDAQARSWFARQQGQTLSEAEQQQLAEWLAANPLHQDAWRRVEEDWLAIDRYRHALNDELKKARRNRPGQHKAAFQLKRRAAAAALLLAVCIPVLYQGMTGTTTYWNTLKGEQQQITLAGGSTLNLDTATRITVTQNWFTHHVQLHEGEIYLETASSDWHTLRVSAEHYEIRDIGTRFSVRYIPDQFMVEVAEGTVEVKKQGQLVLLQAGEVLSIITGSNEWRLAALPAGDIAHWRKGLLVFNAHRLHDVLHEIARYHTVQFDLTDPAIGEIQVSGRFKLDELDTNLQIIADTLKINIEHPAPGRYRLGALRQSTR